MQKAAKMIATEFGGIFPVNIQDLEKLPGVGKYTARAIASFAYYQDVPVKDTNVSRVLQRFFDIQDMDVWGKMSEIVPKGESSNFNQGVMELGALVCSAFSPKCGECVLRKSCHFYQSGKVNLPMLRERKVRYKISPDVVRVAAGLVYRDGKILVMKEKNRLNDY